MDGFGIFVLWVGLSAVAGVIANAKGRSGAGYFFLSLVVSPLIGLILACALPAIDPDGTSDTKSGGRF